MMRSITRQVLVTVVFAQIGLAIVIISLLVVHERHTRLRALDARLQGRADSLAGAIQDSEDAAAHVAVDPREFQAPPKDRYAVYDEQDALIASTAGANTDALVTRTGTAGFRDVRVPSGLYRVKEQPGLRIVDRTETNGVGLRRPITIVYATPATWVRHEIQEATQFYVFAGVLATAFVGLLVIWSLRRSLRPIAELAHAAAQIEAPPGLRFSTPASVRQVQELSVLANSLENAVARVRQAFVKEQQFLSDAAHELKTAVAVMRSSTQVILLRSREPNEYVAGLHRILEDTSRLEDVVHGMLQSAEVTEALPRLAKCDLFESAMHVTYKLRSLSELQGVELVVHGAPDAFVPLSEGHAHLLLENLVSNALQHSFQSGQVVISVHAADEVSLEVLDYGTGIHPDSVDRVFERFYREDVSRSRNTGGTGLGLAICKSIVERAGGRISLESELGKGTRVTVFFRFV